MRVLLAALLMAAPAALEAHAHDVLVDAAGLASPLTNLQQAMAVVAPGDRVFVLPGNYPAFHFSRGVEVVGLGSDPSQVVIARVEFHPTLPTSGWDCGLSNVTVCGAGPEDSTSISGNELASGTLTLQGVVTCGGVYLRGAGGFYLLVADSRVEPAPGGGFLGSAFDFGGGTADIVDSWIRGSDASAGASLAAGVALRIGGGSNVRVTNTRVLGGAGADSGLAFLRNGAGAIDKGFGTAAITLRLAGHSVVQGGDGGLGGAGGAGVALAADIRVGQASVAGGNGTPAGQAYASGMPVQLPYDPYLRLDPPKSFAQGDAFFRPGAQVIVAPGAVLPSPVLGWALRIDPPSSASLSPLPVHEVHAVPESQFVLTASSATLVHRGGMSLPRRRIYVQGFFHESEGGPLVATNPVAVTIAP